MLQKNLFLFFSLSIFSYGQDASMDLKSLYPREDIIIEYQDDWGKNNYKKVIKEFKMKPLNFNDIVFLGNSITAEGKDWSERLNYPNVRNRGIGGDVTDGVLARLKEITYFRPKAVFLLIGINDLWNNSPMVPTPEYIGNNIVRITEAILSDSPMTKVYVQTVLPTGRELYINCINTVNKIIKVNSISKKYKVIDLHSVFVNEKGLIKEDLTTDGIHLNEKGYQTWTEFIKPTIYKIED